MNGIVGHQIIQRFVLIVRVRIGIKRGLEMSKVYEEDDGREYTIIWIGATQKKVYLDV